jgi:alpha-galactosidase
VSALQAEVDAHDTAIWKIRPATGCGAPARMGTITMITTGRHHDIASYSLCMAASGRTEACTANSEETWIVSEDGALQSGGRCLAVADGKVAMQECGGGEAQHWKYNLAGNLINSSDQRCLSNNSASGPGGLTVRACGNNLPNQIWSLPN